MKSEELMIWNGKHPAIERTQHLKKFIFNVPDIRYLRYGPAVVLGWSPSL